jgi:Flp pilus assembly protein TadD
LAAVEDALAATPQDAELLLRRARLQRAGGDFGEAMQTLLDAARYDLHDSRLAAELGELYLAQGRPQAALAAYRQTVALDPKESSHYLRLAELWSSQAELAQSEALLRSGFSHASHPEALYAAQVESYLQQGRVTEAKALIEEGDGALGRTDAAAIGDGRGA